MQSAPEGTYGPHATRTANTLDPRVDSDMDGRAQPATGLNTTSSATANPPANTGERVAQGIKGKIAQGHGLTESLRGNIMSGVDSLVGDKQKQPQHEAIAAGGAREVLEKDFVKKGTLHKSL